MFYGLLNLPWWGYLIVTLVFTQITILSVTIYLHRCQAHRSVSLHPALCHVFRFWLWMTTGMETKAWAAIHRKHHARCETEEDPHSPQIYGIKTVLWKGAELYRLEAKNKETLEKFGSGTPEDWMELNVYRKHSSLGFTLLLIAELIMLGVPGLAIWAMQMMWIPFFAAGIVNGLGHYWGYRNFECADASTNLTPLGIFIGGEELHNNHHTYPTSAKFSVKPWEFDIGWLFLSIFKILGLAQIKRTAPKVQSVPGKHLDLETVRQLIHNRFQVMTRYSKKVILPIWKEEEKRISPTEWKFVSHIKTTLMREPSRVNQQAKESLLTFLSNYQLLKQVYDFREKLHRIWNETTANPKELLEDLQQWCKEAENSGLKALKEFASYIKTYQLKSV